MKRDEFLYSRNEELHRQLTCHRLLNAELLAALKEITTLEIPRTRGTSSEFAIKRLAEACAIAREAFAKAEGER